MSAPRHATKTSLEGEEVSDFLLPSLKSLCIARGEESEFTGESSVINLLLE